MFREARPRAGRQDQSLAQSRVHLIGHVIDQGVVEDQSDEHIAAHADHRGDDGDLARADPIGAFGLHDSTTR